MTRDAVITKLLPIMEDIFDVEDLAYADDITADNIAEWDSLSHIRFMVAIERAFGFRFSTGEIEQYENLGELVSAICSKTQT